MLSYQLQVDHGEEKEEGFDWDKFINDPETKEQDQKQDDPDWQKKWKENIEGDKSEKPEPPKPE